MVAGVDVSSLPVRVPEEFLAPLRVFGPDATESGFRGVYRHNGGYHGKVRVPVGLSGRAPLLAVTPKVSREVHAAYLLALWYRERYGDRWAAVVQSRAAQQQPWRVWHGKAGWHLAVRECGEWHEVVMYRQRKDGHWRPWRRHARDRMRWLGRLKSFHTREEAAAEVALWLKARYGLFFAAVL